MSERFGDQSVAKRLFKFELVFFLSFFTFNCIVLPYVTNWYLFAKYKNQSTYCKILRFLILGRPFYCPVLPIFSIKFFFRVDFKHFASHMVWFCLWGGF